MTLVNLRFLGLKFLVIYNPQSTEGVSVAAG